MDKNKLRYIITSILILVVFVFGCSQKEKVKESSSQEYKLNDDLQIIDISQKQLALYNKHLKTDSAKRVKIFRDSLYYPNQDIWNGYVKNIKTFDLVAEHYGVRTINKLNEKNKLFYSGNNEKELLNSFFKVRDGMVRLTGYSPKGKWYLLYGPSLANLGGVGNGVMFIDFAFPENTDLDAVINWFPHELNHQIQSNNNNDSTNNVLSRCVHEGFAVYVNKIYWNKIGGNKDYSLANSLSWSEQELLDAEQNWDFILSFFKEHYLSEDKDIIDQFGASNLKIKENIPGAIGYFIGYKMVERYVEINGNDSWKDIYTFSSNELLERLEFLKQ